MWSVGRNSDWTKRRQLTSRTVVGNKIQTSRNFKASLCDRYYHLDYRRCLFSDAFWNLRITLWYDTIAILLYLLISIVSYTEIFLTLRHCNTGIHSHNAQQPNQVNQLNITRHKNAVPTAMWLRLTLVACYLPHGVLTALRDKAGLSIYLSR